MVVIIIFIMISLILLFINRLFVKYPDYFEVRTAANSGEICPVQTPKVYASKYAKSLRQKDGGKTYA